MKRVIFWILVAILIAGSMMYPRMLASLPEVGKPHSLDMDKSLMAISDNGTQLHLYSYANEKFTYLGQKFKRGEGPGESAYVGWVLLNPEYIYRYIQGKSMYFTRNGDFIKEFRTLPMRTSFILPIGNKFVMERSYRLKPGDDLSNEISLGAYNPDQGMKHEKILYLYQNQRMEEKGNKGPYKLFHDTHDVEFYGDKIFIGDSMRGLFVEIYDIKGSRVGQVKIFNEKEKIPDTYVTNFYKELEKYGKKDFFNSQYYLYPQDYFPYFFRYFVGKNKIYFLTWVRKGDKREVVITDWQGKQLKKSYVPWLEGGFRNYTMIEDKFYYLVENEDADEWEIHVEEV